MRIELSALVDGETESHETEVVLKGLKADGSMREAWCHYHLIRDALRGEHHLDRDMVAGVVERLKEEPVILAPVARRQASWTRPLAALSASVAGVAVVGWLALVPQASTSPGQIVATKSAPAVSSQAMVTRDMQEYLLAHQANAPGLRLQGGGQNIRTVSVVEGAQ